MNTNTKQLTGDDMRYDSDDILDIAVGQLWESYDGEILIIVEEIKQDELNFWRWDTEPLMNTENYTGRYSVTAKGRFWEGTEGFDPSDHDSPNNLKRRITIDERPELFL